MKKHLLDTNASLLKINFRSYEREKYVKQNLFV